MSKPDVIVIGGSAGTLEPLRQFVAWLPSAMWSALRALEENAAFRQKMADSATARQLSTIAAAYRAQADEYRSKADTVRRVLVGDYADVVEEESGTA